MKEDFDDILRKKWEEKQFPVDQAHRADMIRLLDQNNRRRTGVLWWFFGGGVVCALVAIFAILNDAERLDRVLTPTEVVAPVVDEEAMLPPALPQPGATAQQPSEAENKAQARAKENVGTDNYGSAGRLEVVKKTEPLDEHKPGMKLNKKADAKVEMKEIENSKAKPNAKDAKASTKKKEQTIASAKLIDTPEGNEEEKSTSQIDNTESAVIANSTNTKAEVNPALKSNESESTSNYVDNANENIPLVVRNDFVTDPIDALAFGNIDFSNENEIGNVEPVNVKHHTVWLYAEAGAGFVPAPKSNIRTGYTLRAGGGVGYGLSAKNSLTLSGGYLMQKNGFDFQRSSTVQQSGFGARSNFNTLTPDQLHFVYARLGVHHRIKRHMISVFGGGQYLYGAKGTIVVNSIDQLTGVSNKPTYGWLNLFGMNQMWWNAELNYGYQIMPRLSIQAGVKYSFTSIVYKTKNPDEGFGYYWKGDIASLSPSFTINYHLYGKR